MAKRRSRRRERAWLEKHRGIYRIRYSDPVKKKADGSPRVGCQQIFARDGKHITSEAQAQPELEAFIAKMPPLPTRAQGTVQVEQAHTILQLALRWYAAHPLNKTRAAYMSAIQRMIGPEGLNVTYPGELSAKKVAQFKQDHGGVGVNKELAYLRVVLRWAFGDGNCLDSLDRKLDNALAQPQSKHKDYDLWSDDEFELALAEARRWSASHEGIVRCLGTFGWRPSTACAIRIRDLKLDTPHPEIVLTHVKDVKAEKDRKEVRHPLPRAIAQMLRVLVQGRDPDEHLFLHGGEPWKVGPTGEATGFSDWFQRCCKLKIAPEKGNTNALRKYAIDRMTAGKAPWTQRMNNKQIACYTAHRDLTVIDKRYRATSPEQLRELGGLNEEADMSDSVYVVVDGGVETKHHLTMPDESVSFRLGIG